MIWTAISLFLLIHVAWSDIQRRVIPNIDTLIIFLLGILVAGTKTSPFSVAMGEAMLAAGSAVLVLLPFYLLGWMGAADVKLAASLGIWLGFELLFQVWVLSILMAVLYPKYSSWLLTRKQFIPSDVYRPSQSSKKFVPYGAMLCVSTLLVGGLSIA